MSLPQNEIRLFLDAIVRNGQAAVRFPSPGLAMRARQSIYSYRKKAQEEARALYTQDDPNWGVTEWDHVTLFAKKGSNLLIGRVSKFELLETIPENENFMAGKDWAPVIQEADDKDPPTKAT